MTRNWWGDSQIYLIWRFGLHCVVIFVKIELVHLFLGHISIIGKLNVVNWWSLLYVVIDAEFSNTGLERSEPLAKDLGWFKEQGYAIPEPSSPGITYARYLEELSENDPQAFICHFYNIYFAHTAGGRMIGRKVSNKYFLEKLCLSFILICMQIHHMHKICLCILLYLENVGWCVALYEITLNLY